MDQKTTATQCNRGDDLVSFLYGEATEREAADFQTHLRQCSSCATELADFGQMHESMMSWRDEMLAGFESSPLPAPVRQKSALAALREFFDLSPLWMKGAVGFATLLLLAFGFLGVSRMSSNTVETMAVRQTEAKYSDQELQQRIAQARQEWEAKNQPQEVTSPAPEIVKPQRSATPVKVVKSAPARSRSPLSKSERDQLAADLRLSSADDEKLNLLGDRINQQF